MAKEENVLVTDLIWIMENLPIDFIMKEECPVDTLMCAIGRLRCLDNLPKLERPERVEEAFKFFNATSTPGPNTKAVLDYVNELEKLVNTMGKINDFQPNNVKTEERRKIA